MVLALDLDLSVPLALLGDDGDAAALAVGRRTAPDWRRVVTIAIESR